MLAPGREDAAFVLLSLDPSPWFVRHARGVAEVASWLASRAGRRGLGIDRPAVEAAALLHDVDKALPPTDPIRRLRHGEGSAAWLTAHGHPELAPLVARHPVTRLADPDAVAWLADAPLEALLVAYADKRAGQHLEPMEERFAGWARRYPLGAKHGWDEATVEQVLARARRLERDVCDRLAIEPDEVRRIRWTRAALQAAMAADGRDPITTRPGTGRSSPPALAPPSRGDARSPRGGAR
jgi:HD superfamily phosphodiesterase